MGFIVGEGEDWDTGGDEDPDAEEEEFGPWSVEAVLVGGAEEVGPINGVRLRTPLDMFLRTWKASFVRLVRTSSCWLTCCCWFVLGEVPLPSSIESFPGSGVCL